MRPALASAVPLARLSPPPATPPSAPQGDFAANMKLLQRYPPVDVNLLVRRADALEAS